MSASKPKLKAIFCRTVACDPFALQRLEFDPIQILIFLFAKVVRVSFGNIRPLSINVNFSKRTFHQLLAPEI